MPDTYAVSDSPITKPEDDLYERGEFCSLLADELCLREDMPSVVIGLEGDWGSGKTSCINLAKEQLIKRRDDEKAYTNKPILVTFNPWRISTLDSLVEGFFLELASAIGTLDTAEVKNVARGILSFAKYLSPIRFIPGAEPWASLITSLGTSLGESIGAAAEFAGLSLERRRESLVKSMEKMNRPVVVFIDDVDRLPPEEIRTLFQLIKCIADFPRVAYLVAYDPTPVIAALSYNGVIDGRNYLDKIVQVVYPMPLCGQFHRREHLENAARELFDNIRQTPDEDEEQLLMQVFNDVHIESLVNTPRQIKRIINNTYIASCTLKNEVCFSDILVLKVIETVFPYIAEQLYKSYNYSLFTNPSIDPLDYYNCNYLREPDTNKSIKNFLNNILKDNKRLKEKIEELKIALGFIFPNADDSIYANTQHNNRYRTKLNRICNGNSFMKYLHFGSYERAFSIKEASFIFEKNKEEIKIILERHKEHAAEWIDLLASLVYENDIVIKNNTDIFEYILSFFIKYSGQKDYTYSLLKLIDALAFKYDCYKINEYFDSIIQNLDYFDFITNATRIMVGSMYPFKIQSQIDKEKLRDSWLKVMKERVVPNDLFNLPHPHWALYAWFELAQLDAQDYVVKKLREELWARKFIEPYREKAESGEEIGSFPAFLPEDWFTVLKEHFESDPNIMKVLEWWRREHVQEQHPVSLPSSGGTPSS